MLRVINQICSHTNSVRLWVWLRWISFQTYVIWITPNHPFSPYEPNSNIRTCSLRQKFFSLPLLLPYDGKMVSVRLWGTLSHKRKRTLKVSQTDFTRQSQGGSIFGYYVSVECLAWKKNTYVDIVATSPYCQIRPSKPVRIAVVWEVANAHVRIDPSNKGPLGSVYVRNSDSLTME